MAEPVFPYVTVFSTLRLGQSEKNQGRLARKSPIPRAAMNNYAAGPPMIFSTRAFHSWKVHCLNCSEIGV
jgi:hypothetical protein